MVRSSALTYEPASRSSELRSRPSTSYALEALPSEPRRARRALAFRVMAVELDGGPVFPGRGERLSRLSIGIWEFGAHVACFGVEAQEEFVGEGDTDHLFGLPARVSRRWKA